ncbi:unnamed protein product (macronuclear) [Paramecium tetraurelia]|uniref:Transmembrane protein n=1 Tax=Paramecium tetraurelia TaxID=5888 RepID=A0C249_PARTE|nr:uncharacterized protein GSPATT00034343001 [Paramecium tetraurelia]CAK64866.1 unnamed protein product [Paramecium tetraurelia]|eukprot:XP_001432263.1 hypothetical protein (macronuclear) [Paramecium tetraurelia strain d4-2]
MQINFKGIYNIILIFIFKDCSTIQKIFCLVLTLFFLDGCEYKWLYRGIIFLSNIIYCILQSIFDQKQYTKMILITLQPHYKNKYIFKILLIIYRIYKQQIKKSSIQNHENQQIFIQCLKQPIQKEFYLIFSKFTQSFRYRKTNYELIVFITYIIYIHNYIVNITFTSRQSCIIQLHQNQNNPYFFSETQPQNRLYKIKLKINYLFTLRFNRKYKSQQKMKNQFKKIINLQSQHKNQKQYIKVNLYQQFIKKVFYPILFTLQSINKEYSLIELYNNVITKEKNLILKKRKSQLRLQLRFEVFFIEEDDCQFTCQFNLLKILINVLLIIRSINISGYFSLFKQNHSCYTKTQVHDLSYHFAQAKFLFCHIRAINLNIIPSFRVQVSKYSQMRIILNRLNSTINLNKIIHKMQLDQIIYQIKNCWKANIQSFLQQIPFKNFPPYLIQKTHLFLNNYDQKIFPSHSQL